MDEAGTNAHNKKHKSVLLNHENMDFGKMKENTDYTLMIFNLLR